jgi:hypothetical protein
MALKKSIFNKTTTATITLNTRRSILMPTYEIEQYELHVQKYRVEATTEAEAIAKLLDGEAEAVDNSLEYVEVAEDYGLPADDDRDLAEALRDRGISIGEVIHSIRGIVEV